MPQALITPPAECRNRAPNWFLRRQRLGGEIWEKGSVPVGFTSGKVLQVKGRCEGARGTAVGGAHGSALGCGPMAGAHLMARLTAYFWFLVPPDKLGLLEYFRIFRTTSP